MSDVIICVNKHMASRFEKFKKPVFIIPNYPSINFMKSKLLCNVKLPDNTIIYIGGINEERNVRKLVKIFSIIRSKYHYNANLAIFGNGDEKYLEEVRSLAQELGVSSHLIIGKVSYKEVPFLLKQAKIGIFLLKKDNPAHQWGEPVKFFEYAAAGLPVIMSDLPAKRRLVNLFRNGYVVDPSNEMLIAKMVAELLNNPQKMREMGASGKKCFHEEYNWEANWPEIQKLFKVFETDKINDT
ncbi:MAG TPA: glycosyltransferase [Thiotrichaceae bacterium]|nr:glycosyltransferase [Thiotrichaceae bacterium]